MIRHRFWKNALCAVVALLLMQPAAHAQTTQRSPSTTIELAPGSGYVAPANRSGIGGSGAGWGSRARAVAEEAGPEKKVLVGLLLPLTGRNAELGRAMQDAATVSLFDKYAGLSPKMQSTKVVLIPKDTGDSPQQAAAAAQAAIAEGAQFIIGPVFSDEVEAIAPIAKSKNIPVLSLSNNRARIADGIYAFGFSPQEQTVRVINYAIDMGKTKIAVLGPRSPLGDAVIEAARIAAKTAEIELVSEAQYAAQGVGIEAALNQLIPQGTEPSFDALLLPESGPALNTILQALAGRGVVPSKVQFIGTGMWDDAALLRRVNLDGAWFASSPVYNTTMFENRFRTTYKYTPPRVASLAYDAVALAITLATSGRSFNAESLTNIGGFRGPANGLYRLRADGSVERNLEVIQVNNGNVKVISKSPGIFK
jgi:branched-chain amino acid transport system substrate-binding protein